MTSKGVIFLLVLAGLVTPAAHWLATQASPEPGFGRTLIFGGVIGAALLLGGRIGERLGWITGRLEIGRDAKRPPPAGSGPSASAAASTAHTTATASGQPSNTASTGGEVR